MQIRLTSRASKELEAAAYWYEEQSRGLGSEFIRTIDASLLRICRAPTLYPVAFDDMRRCLIKKFPFGIFFVLEQDHIVVISVFHSRRDPKKLKK